MCAEVLLNSQSYCKKLDSHIKINENNNLKIGPAYESYSKNVNISVLKVLTICIIPWFEWKLGMQIFAKQAMILLQGMAGKG